MVGQLGVETTHQEPNHSLEDKGDDEKSFRPDSIYQESADESTGHVEQLRISFNHDRIGRSHVDNRIPAKDSLQGGITTSDGINNLQSAQDLRAISR